MRLAGISRAFFWLQIRAANIARNAELRVVPLRDLTISPMCPVVADQRRHNPFVIERQPDDTAIFERFWKECEAPCNTLAFILSPPSINSGAAGGSLVPGLAKDHAVTSCYLPEMQPHSGKSKMNVVTTGSLMDKSSRSFQAPASWSHAKTLRPTGDLPRPKTIQGRHDVG